ncbi:MAG TPA: LamG domain-containing protein [Candidatus Tyrphobacter sp.]|nr:LamG domain-containing protein [Candidatus Tyrphobacter sp.]
MFLVSRERKSREGQSLAEILVSVAVGAIVIGAAIAGIIVTIRANAQNRAASGASSIAQGVLNNVQSVADGNWNAIYNLSPKGTSAPYYLIQTGSTSTFVSGEEGVPGNDIQTGLIGHWQFDESTVTTTAYDASGNGNNGTAHGTAIVAGKLGNARSFNGSSDYIGTQSGGGLYPAMTTALWFKTTSASGTHDLFSFLQGTCGSDVFQLTPTSFLGLYCFSDGSDALASTNQTVNDGNWHFATLTYDGSHVKIYIDGLLAGTSGLASGKSIQVSADGGAYFFIGSYLGGGGFFPGTIDDVRVYNRALTASEIQNLYNSIPYTAYFTVSDVNRDTCGTGAITSSATTTCVGGSGILPDPATELITATTNWVLSGGSTSTVTLSEYLTRSKDKVNLFSNWNGSSGVSGPITLPDNNYSTSSNVNASTQGQIQLLTY